MSAKPRFRIVDGTLHPVSARETPLDAARRRYGRDFCTKAWKVGEGPRYFTAEKIASMAEENARLRAKRHG